MNSLSDLYKGRDRFLVETGTSIKIPDAPIFIPPLREKPVSIAKEGAEEKERETTESTELSSLPQSVTLSKDELAERFAKELAEIKREAREEGIREAAHQKKGEIRDCIDLVEQTLNELHDLHKAYIHDYTKELKYFAIDIAEKVMLARIEENDLVLKDMVMQTVNSVKNAQWLKVEVSDRLSGLVAELEKELASPVYQGKAEVTPASVLNDTCKVHTNKGTIIASITEQTGNLRLAFQQEEFGS